MSAPELDPLLTLFGLNGGRHRCGCRNGEDRCAVYVDSPDEPVCDECRATHADDPRFVIDVAQAKS